METSTDVLDAIEKRLRNCLQNAKDTKEVLIGDGAVDSVVDVFARHFGEETAVVVADRNTYDVLGSQVVNCFRAAGHASIEPYVYGQEHLPAHYEEVDELIAFLRGHQAIPIAVGSGTINDLTKLASYHADRRYLSVATAASMDGYTAYGSSITQDGFKQHFSCPAPIAVVADLDIIRDAPEGMNASGYADLLAKVESGADWILADALGLDPIDTPAWSLIQPNLRAWLANPDGIRQRDGQVVAYLIEGLIMAGLAMQSCSSSRPAAGAEHQFSHLWDMQGHTYQGEAPSHGFKVGIGTLASVALYERILEKGTDAWQVEEILAAWPDRDTLVERARNMHPNKNLVAVAEREVAAKYIAKNDLRKRLEYLQKIWPDLQAQLQQQLLPVRELQQMLRAVGAPVEPERIGIERDRLRASYALAQTIRRRYTVLDLAFESGRFEPEIAALFEPSGFWGK